MPEASGNSQASGKQKPLYYPLTSDEWLDVVKRLRKFPAAKDVLYYIRTLDPFGDRLIEIKVRELARTLGYDPSTISRALKFLDHEKYIDLDLISVRVRVRSKVRNILSSQNVAHTQQCCTHATALHTRNSVVHTQHLNDDSDLEPAPGASSGNGKCTNNKEQTLKENNKQTKQEPTPHPVDPDIDREGFGTGRQVGREADLTRLLELINAAGIRTNKTLQQTLARLNNKQGAAAALRAVENALSALQEQQAQGTVRNPGGFLNAALRGNFTANAAKRQAREHPKITEPPPLNQVAAAVDQALLCGDRGFALAKLQSLWDEGYHDLLEELLYLFKRDWQFELTNQGVRDATEPPG